MSKKGEKYPSPRFSSAQEEDEYWKSHSPLDEGYRGTVQTSKQKRSSLLSVRLTGEELTQLRDMAAEIGTGPSTLARVILKTEIAQRKNLDECAPYRYKYAGSPTEYLFESNLKPGSEIVPPNIGVLSPGEIEFNRVLSQEVLFKLLQLCELCGFRIETQDDAGLRGFGAGYPKELKNAEKTQP